MIKTVTSEGDVSVTQSQWSETLTHGAIDGSKLTSVTSFKLLTLLNISKT